MKAFEPFLLTEARSAWITLPPDQVVPGLGAALAADGWKLIHSGNSIRDVLDALAGWRRDPGVLITGMRLADGDALELIRTLASLPNPPALYFLSREEPAVVKSARALARALALRVAGQEEHPFDPARVVAQLDRCRMGTGPCGAFPAAGSAAPLAAAQARRLFLDRGIRAYLQPKVHAVSGEVVGFESLMRGVDRDGSIIAPSRLLAPIEEAGLLADVTLEMVEQTVAFVHEALSDGFPIAASVNVTLGLLSDRAFCRSLTEKVERAGIDPSWLTIEITEAEAMSDAATVIENAGRIRMLGFNLSIDDFGTAYSSFSHLLQIPFSELKIDRSFVSGMRADPTKEALVSACATIGSRLRLHVVAEGVETAEELAAVQGAGCSAIQGFLVSRPQASSDALAWLRSLTDLRATLPAP